MKKAFKAHPLMLYSFMKPFLFVLVIPVIKGGIQYLLYQKITGVLLFESILAALLFFFAYFRLKAFKVTVCETHIEVKKGFIIKERAIIPKARISSIKTSENLIDTLFRCVTLRINTEAGTVGTADFKVKLSRKNADELYFLIYGKEKNIPIKFSNLKIASLSAATSSALTGLILGVPITNQASKMLGVSLSEVIFLRINDASQKFNTYMPPLVNIITIVALIAYGFAFVFTFLRNIGFSLSANEEKMEIKSGFFVKRRIVFKKENINNLYLEQTPMMKLFKVYSLCACVAGLGDGRKERATVIPCGGKRELKAMMKLYFPTLTPSGSCLMAPRSYANGRRFLFWPTLLTMGLLLVGTLAGAMFPEFIKVIMFVSAVLLAMIVYYGDICLVNYRFAKVSFGERVYLSGSKGLSLRRICCKKENVGIIRISRTPADKRFSTCNVKVTIRSESAIRIKVRHLDCSSLAEEIEKCYEIEGIF